MHGGAMMSGARPALLQMPAAAGMTVNRAGPYRRGFRFPPRSTGPGAAAGAGVVLSRFYAARSMAGSQPVPASSSAARAAMSPLL